MLQGFWLYAATTTTARSQRLRATRPLAVLRTRRHLKAPLDSRSRRYPIQPRADVRKRLEVSHILSRLDPSVTCHISNGVRPGKVITARKSQIEHPHEPIPLLGVAVDGVRHLLGCELHKVVQRTKHGSQAPHLK